MPTYATRSDLDHFFSSTNVTDWADKDRDGVLSADESLAVDAGLEAAEAMIDTQLRKAGYAAPFELSEYTLLPARLRSLLKQWTVVIAGFHLYAWRGLQDRANPFENLYHKTVDQLKAVAEGAPLAGLGKATQVRFGTGTDAPQPTDDLSNLKDDAWNW